MPFLAVHRQEAAILVCSVVGEDGMEQAEAIIQVSEKNTTTNPIAQILAATSTSALFSTISAHKAKIDRRN
jgi:hypothetical protein